MTHHEITSRGRTAVRRLWSEPAVDDAPDVTRLVPAWEVDPDAATPLLVAGERPEVSVADLVATSALPAAAAMSVLADVAAVLELVHASGVAHGDLRRDTVLVLPDGRAALSRPEAPRRLKRNGRGRARQEDHHGFAALAADLLTDPPAAAAAVIDDALKGDIGRRPEPRALLAELTRIPAAAWATETPAPTRKPADRPAPVIRLGSWPPWLPATGPVPVIRLGSWPDSMPATYPPPLETLPFIPEGVEERQRAHRPRRQRSLPRRVMEPFVVLVGMATVVAGAAGGAFLLLSPSSSAGDPGVGPPQVRRVFVSVTPPRAQCPRASMHVATTILLDGGEGKLQVRWRLPDGSLAETQSVSVRAGDSTVRAAMDLTFAGSDNIVGDIVAVVGQDGVRASAPVRYVCPDRKRKPRQSRGA